MVLSVFVSTKAMSAYDKFYTQSPQFTTRSDPNLGYQPIVKDGEQADARKLADGVIGTQVITKYNVQSLIAQQEFVDFRQLGFKFQPTSVLYTKIVRDARGALPPDPKFTSDLNDFYESVIIKHLTNLYEHSAAFFATTFYNKQQINHAAFELYQQYIYLIAMIVYINTHQDRIRDLLGVEADVIIRWGQNRNEESLTWILRGPTDSYRTPPNFAEHYDLLISTATQLSDVMGQSSLGKMSMIYSEISQAHSDAIARPNSYLKNFDNARQYYIVVDDSDKMTIQRDTNNNLLFDLSFIDLGGINNNITARYQDITVSDKLPDDIPSRILFRAIEDLFRRYSCFSIYDLSVSQTLFANDISKYVKLYIVFPGISTVEHTVYGDLPRGTLMIAGRFELNANRRMFEFKPSEDLVTFDGSQTHVSNFQFYITDNPRGRNTLVPTDYTIPFNKSQIFNHVTSTGLSGNAKLVTIDAFISKINIQLPSSLSDINVELLPEVLTSAPQLVKDYLKGINEMASEYKRLETMIIPAAVDNRAAIPEYNPDVGRLNELRTTFEAMMKLTKLYFKWFGPFADVQSVRYDPLTLGRDISSLRTSPGFQQILEPMKQDQLSVQRVSDLVRQVMALSVDEIIYKHDILTRTPYQDAANILISLIELISSKMLVLDTKTKTFTVSHGLIDGHKFKYDNGTLTIMTTEDGSDEYDDVPDDQNNIVAMSFFDQNGQILNYHSFAVDPMRWPNRVQLLTTNVVPRLYGDTRLLWNTGLTVIRRVKTDKLCLGGGFEELDINNVHDDDPTHLYAVNLIDYINDVGSSEIYLDDDHHWIKYARYVPNQFIGLVPFELMHYRRHYHNDQYPDSDREQYVILRSDRLLEVDISSFMNQAYIYGQAKYNANFIDGVSTDMSVTSNGVIVEFKATNDYIQETIVDENGTETTITYINSRTIVTRASDFEITFDLDCKPDTPIVTKMVISKFNVEGIEYELDQTMTFDPFTITGSNDISTVSYNISEDAESHISTIKTSNIFKAWDVKTHLLKQTWNRDILINSLVSMPVPLDVAYPRYESDTTIIAGDASSILYAFINDERKRLIAAYPDTNDFITDYGNVSEVYLYTQSIQTYKFTGGVNAGITAWDMDDLHVEATTANVDDTIYIKSLRISRSVDARVQMLGIFHPRTTYQFPASHIDPTWIGECTLSLEYNTIDHVEEGVVERLINVTSIELTVQRVELKEYTVTDGQVYVAYPPHYFASVYRPIRTGTIDRFIDPYPILKKEKKLNYPVFKYSQQQIYLDMDEPNMIINKQSTIPGSRAYLRREPTVEKMNIDTLQLTQLVSHDQELTVFRSNGMLQVQGFTNTGGINRNVIEADTGYIVPVHNNLLTMSMNIK